MSTRWSPFSKQIAIVAGLIGVVWLLSQVRVLLAPVIIALLLAYIVSFPVRWLLRQTGWPRLVAVLVTYLFVLVIVVTAPVLVIPRLVALFGAFSATLRSVVQQLAAVTPSPIELAPALTIDLGPFYEPISEWLRSVIQPSSLDVTRWQTFLFPFASSAAVVVRSAVSSVLWIFFVLFISFYVVKDAPVMGRFLAGSVPEALRPDLRRLQAEFSGVWESFVRGQLVLGLYMGVIVWLVTALLGLRNSAALGLLSGVLEFIPGLGPVIATIPAVLIALIFGSTWLPMANVWFAVLVAVVYAVLSQIENMYLVPRVIGRRISLHPVVVIVGALAGAQLGGALGIFLAAPTIASGRVVAGYIVRKILDEEPFGPLESPPEPYSLWRDRMERQPVAAILFDLDGTLARVDDRLVLRLAGRLGHFRRLLPLMRPEQAARRVLIAGEWLANLALTCLRRLRLKKLLQRLDGLLHTISAFCPPEEATPVEGALETMHALGKDRRIGIITTRGAKEVRTFLAQHYPGASLDVLVSRDHISLYAPHPAVIHYAAKRMGLKPEQCLVVADTPLMVNAAKKSGAAAVGVLTGLGDTSDLQHADLVISSAARLPALLTPQVMLGDSPKASQPPSQVNPVPISPPGGGS